SALARIYPVPDGVGSLNSTANPQPGVRWSESAMLDVHGLTDASGAPIVDGNGHVCINSSTLAALKGRLADAITAWNSQTPGQADVAVGVEDPSLSGGSNCSLGLAAVGQPVTMVQMSPDVVGAPSATGAVFAMELAHTQGDIPTSSSRMDQT